MGVTPRRNPDIVVAVFFEGGEHGKLAARLAAQVIHAWVEKQRKVRNDLNYAAVDKDGRPVELSGIWNEGTTEEGGEKLGAGTLVVQSANASSAPAVVVKPSKSVPRRVPAAAPEATLAAQVH